MSAAHIAWLRYTDAGAIVTCDSDAPKAFAVYRANAIDEGVREALRKYCHARSLNPAPLTDIEMAADCAARAALAKVQP